MYNAITETNNSFTNSQYQEKIDPDVFSYKVYIIVKFAFAAKLSLHWKDKYGVEVK